MTTDRRPRDGLLSVVVPVYDEEEVLPHLHERLVAVLDGLPLRSEVVFVDDGSRDRSVVMLQSIVARDDRFRLVELSRNFGHQAAITAGMDIAAGDAVVVIDADLQDPPEVIAEMVEQWQAGSDVVYGVRRTRTQDTWFKRSSAAFFYRILDRLVDIDVPPDAADFRLLDRSVLRALGHLREGDRYLRGLISWLGFTQTEVTYERPARAAGTTKFPLRAMLRFAADGIISFSVRPLRWAVGIGSIVSLVAFAFVLVTIVQKIAGYDFVSGWASIVIGLAFFSGIQMVMLGVIGVYIGHLHTESKQRPLYIVRTLTGFAEAPVEARRAVLPAPDASRTP